MEQSFGCGPKRGRASVPCAMAGCSQTLAVASWLAAAVAPWPMAADVALLCGPRSACRCDLHAADMTLLVADGAVLGKHVEVLQRQQDLDGG